MPKYNSIDASIILSEFYETLFKLYNHYSGDNSRPLASVALHPQEDINTNSLLEENIKMYVKKNIKETFGLNYLEFVNLPRDVCEMMTDVAQEELKRKVNAGNDVQQEFNKLTDSSS